MTAVLALHTPTWTLQSTLWLTLDLVELWLTADDGGESLVTVRVAVDLPRTASEPAYREELVVVDIDGAPVADSEVERHREQILREFYSAKSLGRA